VFPTWVLLVASFGATIAIAVAWNKPGLPALPLLSVAFLLDYASGRSLYAAAASYHAYLEFPVLLALVFSSGVRR